MNEKTYAQKVLHNEGNNTQSGNIFDFKNANIGTQNNYYQSKNNIFEIFIDNNQIESWYKNNLTNIDNLLHSILNLKYDYIKNNNINIVVETSRLQSLDKAVIKTKDIKKRFKLYYDIKNEIEKCNQIKILLKIIVIDVLNIDDVNSQKIIFEVLHNICNNPIDQKEPWFFRDEPIKIYNFLQDIKNYTDEKIEKKTTEFIESFGVAKFAIWTQLPFKCTFVFNSGVEFSVFNIFNKCKNSENCKKRDMFYRNLLDNKKEDNILSMYYSYLTAFVALKDINIDKLDYWFFNLRLKDIKYEYDNLQLELQKINIPHEYKNINIDYRYVHDGWSDEMFNTYFKMNFKNINIKYV